MSTAPKILAHRGASHYYPENTMAAFEAALQMGCQWFEFDVQLSRDGELIVIHDHELKRTTNGKGLVADFSAQELQEFDAGSWFDNKFQDERIPLLRDVLSFLQQNNCCANVEVKPAPGAELATAKATIKLLDSIWFKPVDNLVLSSFSTDATAVLAKSTYPLGLLYESLPATYSEQIEQYQPRSIHLWDRKLNADDINLIKESYPELWLLIYTVNDAWQAQELWQAGVDGVFTDCPAELLACRKEQN